MVSPQIRSQWSSLHLLLCNQKQDLVEEYFCLCPIVVGQRRLGLSSSTSHSLLKPEVWAQCSFWSHHAKYGIQMYVAGEKEKKKRKKKRKANRFSSANQRSLMGVKADMLSHTLQLWSSHIPAGPPCSSFLCFLLQEHFFLPNVQLGFCT